MSIGARVLDSINKIQNNDGEGALFAICAAIEETANREYGRRGRTTYKQFVSDNLSLITELAFCGVPTIHRIRLEYAHPKLVGSPDGCYSIEDILYHVVRCGLYHEAGMPLTIRFELPQVIHCNQGTLVLPISLISALILTIVLSPGNTGESIGQERLTQLPIRVERLWGRRSELIQLLKALE